mmetsp:Transcript_52238/g.111236  ORF Transcript_52238/g.111236 Transcript_52238/m.111236 type:complete len:346 (+) Transcript_52238:462-1499(+)
MGNHQRRPSIHQLLKSFLDEVLCSSIQRRSGLVQQEDGRVRQDSASDANPLLLATSHVLDCAHLCLEPLWELLLVVQCIPDVGSPASILDFLRAGLVLAADDDVVPNGQGYEVRLLGYSSNLGSQPLRIVLADVFAIQLDGAPGNVIEALEQFEDCAFPTTCLADDADDLPRSHLEGGSVQYIATSPPRVGEGDVVEDDVTFGLLSRPLPCTAIDRRFGCDDVVGFGKLGAFGLHVKVVVIRTLDLFVDFARVMYHGAGLTLSESALPHQVTHQRELRNLRSLSDNLGGWLQKVTHSITSSLCPLRNPHHIFEDLRFSGTTDEALVQRGVLRPQRIAEGVVVSGG